MIAPARIIERKRDRGELEESEIRDFVAGLSTGEVTDYQATAFLMAVTLNGMSLDETVALTRAMLESGDRHAFPEFQAPKSDKHSTGGVGDKVSLVLAPLAAACGLKVPMMSGRGLGHSGGTIDKLESIHGYRAALGRDEIARALESAGCAIFSQSERIAPADRKLYALRDVTGTVECIPLIVASILSKKLAEGIDTLVLDVKCGSGAFMKTREKARRLAKTLVTVARKLGLRARALVTDMSQPLGYAAGNALEVAECLEILDGARSPFPNVDLRELIIQLCAEMLELSDVTRTLAEGRRLALARLKDGSAARRFELLARAQGATDDWRAKLRFSRERVAIPAVRSGYIDRMETDALGRLVVELGGGRLRAGDPIDQGVGLVFHHRLGAKVREGEPIVTAYLPENLNGQRASLETRAREEIARAISISKARKPVPKLILERIA